MLLLSFGYGYTARCLSALVTAQGIPTLGTTRDGREGTLVYQSGEIGDAVRTALAQASHILISTPPHAGEPALAEQIAGLATRARWIGYLSTTGVYGDQQGRMVDETTPVAPVDAQAETRVASEHLWRSRQAHIFRLSGIYGPGRSVFDSIAEGRGQIIEKPGHRFNRIHVADIACALWASMQAPTPGSIYNLADDAPAPQADVMRYAYGLLGQTPPPPISVAKANLSPMAQRFWAASRQVNASKIKTYHGISWEYPTYREGLAAILQECGS